MTRIGLLHPGAMGAAVGGALQAAGHEVCWASAGRSDATARRANELGFTDCGDLEGLVGQVEVLLSICPPAAALELAGQVRDAGFAGTYLDANAVAPQTAVAIAEALGADADDGAPGAGITVVDGGIIGGPNFAGGTTELCLSGVGAADLAAQFDPEPLGVVVVDGPIGAASGLKMAFAAWTKGSSALLLGVRTLATSLGVDEALMERWRLRGTGDEDRSLNTLEVAGRKAWRFVGEMEEIAETFRASGLPTGFHEAAGEVFGAFERDEDARALGFAGVAARLGSGTDASGRGDAGGDPSEATESVDPGR